MLNQNQSNLTDKHVVIVDDDVPSIRYYETILKTAGADVTIVKNGREFSEFVSLEGVKADLVIMDYLVPFLNGVECTRLFRKSNRSIPVIMITAYCSDQLRSEAFIAGCNEFILKPVFPEKLLGIIEKYLVLRNYVPSV